MSEADKFERASRPPRFHFIRMAIDIEPDKCLARDGLVII